MKDEKKYKLKIKNKIYNVGRQTYEDIVAAKRRSNDFIKIGSTTFASSEVQVITDGTLDWSMFNNHTEIQEYKNYKDIPEEEKVVSDEKAFENRELIKQKIREMFLAKKKGIHKKQDKLPLDERKKQLESVKHLLIDEMRGITFPNDSNPSWAPNNLFTGHFEGREHHKTRSYSMQINLNFQEFASDFECDAIYVYCDECRKYLKKELRLWDHLEGQVSVLDKLVV